MLAEYPEASAVLLWLWTLLAWTAVAGVAVAVISARLAPGWFARDVRPAARPLTVTVAWTTLVGSLALSELHGFAPCSLCWVQRALLYPQVLLVPLATGRHRWLRWVVWASTAAAGVVASYQVLIERGVVGATTVCSIGVASCAAIWTDRLGMTIPTMSLAAAVSVAVGVYVATRPSSPDGHR